jgi:hypothetical protein
MKKLNLLIALAITIPATHADAVTFSNSHVDLIAACINASIEANATSKNGQFLTFNCYGGPAQALYDALASLNNTGQVQSDTNLQRWLSRTMASPQAGGQVVSNACYQATQGPAGEATSGFSCSLSIAIELFLN